jgi:hypothetical protein
MGWSGTVPSLPRGRRDDVVVDHPARGGKRERHIYLVQADRQWLHSLTHRSYLGRSGPTWWAYPTDWLWKPPYSELPLVLRGALATLVCMFCRSRDAYNEAAFETTRKELRMLGLTDRVLREISANFAQIQITRLSGSGEIKDL